MRKYPPGAGEPRGNLPFTAFYYVLILLIVFLNTCLLFFTTLFYTFYYEILLFYYVSTTCSILFTTFSKKHLKKHLDVLFRTVSLGSPGPPGSVLRRFRKLEKVEEGRGRLEKVG